MIAAAYRRAVAAGEMIAELWNTLLLLLRALLPYLVAFLAALVLSALFSRQPWPFSVEASSEYVKLQLAPGQETKWRIGGAILCVRTGGAEEASGLPVSGDASYCPSRRWRAFDLSGFEEAVLTMPARPAATGPYTAEFLAKTDGGLALEVNGGNDEGRSLALQLDGQSEPLQIGDSALLHFPVPGAGAPAGRLLLPFSGSGSLGKDVSWSEPSLLRSGTVSLYTRSEEAAGGRRLVSTSQLLPGDRVDLGAGPLASPGLVKGFVHFDLVPAPGEPPTMTIVALGEAETVQIVRFGDQGYSFSPGIIARLTHHSAVSTWAMAIIFLLGLMSVLKDGSELGRGRLRDYLLRLWKPLRDPRRETGDPT